MYMVTTTNGKTFDSDMVGPVGVIADKNDFFTFVQRHGSFTEEQMDKATFTMREVVIFAAYEEYELMEYGDGHPIAMLRVPVPNRSERFYFIEEFRKQQ